MFKVKVSTNCVICGKPNPKRFRTYCSKQCRNKRNTQKSAEYRKEWVRKRSGAYKPGKLQCIICGGWYVQVGSHVIQRNKEFATAKDYRIEFDMPIKKGITPDWFKKLKAEQCKQNGTIKNMKGGKKFWYKKGDPRAKEVVGMKGRFGSKGYKHNINY